MTFDNTLDILLIEDNPGDARLFKEILRESKQLLQRFDSEEQSGSEMQIHHEETLESGLEQLSVIDADVILLDLGLPDSRGLETLTVVADAAELIPIVVLTGLSDEAIGMKAIQSGAQDYLVKDEVTGDLLVRSIHYAIERNRQERERARRREQLEAINRLNEIGHDVTHAVITTSTREELEQAVCDQFVNSDNYPFAWIGEVNRANSKISPRVAAGVEDGYLDEITITTDKSKTADGPAGRAAKSGSVQVMQNVQTDPAFEPWREQAVKRGYRSGASVPIHHEGLQYGVLNIYASSPNAFSEPEREILSRLGEVIGHAITAIERQEALVSDTVLELEFRADTVVEELCELTAKGTSRISLNEFVQTNDGVLAYGRAIETPRETFEEAVMNEALVDELRILSSGEEMYRFEIVTTAVSPLIDAIGAHGGRFTSATIADGDLRFVIEFPPGNDKRQLIELVEEHCPNAANRAQRLVQRTDDNSLQAHSAFHESLTEKQRTALRTAYSAGLFEWPRQSTAQEIADRLGIAPPTFSQHLRAAERLIFAEIFSDSNTETSAVDD